MQAAFSALMRLSLRLMAERGGRDDRLGRYLDDPLQLFIPVRLLIGVLHRAGRRARSRALSDIRDACSVDDVHRLARRVRRRLRAPAADAHRAARSRSGARRPAAGVSRRSRGC